MRIGFIAMSGVRAHNPELTKLGLTLPGFVERNKIIASLPSLGLLTLAGMTPPSEGFSTEYREVADIRDAKELPGDFDVVAISSFSAQIKEAYELADRYRSHGTKVVLGGLHVSALPEEAKMHADAIVVGEGEPVWPSLLSDLKSGNLKTVYDARSTPFDFAAAPLPAFHLLDFERYNRLTVQTQRGCPWRCDFCAASIRISPTFKVKPINKVLAEVRAIKNIWKRPFIEFADDNTFVNKKHSKALLRKLVAEDLRWFTETDISVADDDELLGLMRDSGCAQVLIGLESPTHTTLNGIEQRMNWKAKQLDKYAQSIAKIQSYGISVNGCFILGLDGADVSSFDHVFDFVKESGLFEVQITVATAFPGTPFYTRLRDSGRILKQGAWELCTLFDVNFQPSHMSVEELEKGLRDLGEKLYSEENTKERKDAFKAVLRERVRSKRREAVTNGNSTEFCNEM